MSEPPTSAAAQASEHQRDDATTVPAATADTSAAKHGKSKKVPLRRPRGRRGGIKHRKAELDVRCVDAAKRKDAKTQTKGVKKRSAIDRTGQAAEGAKATAEHALAIARFHTLEKQLAQTQDPKERARIQAEQAKVGGLHAYQDASLVGGCKLRGGETGKWCAEQLAHALGQSHPAVRLLDVGALQGTAYEKFPWISTVAIDINPRNEHVLKSDFFDFAVPDKDEERFDVVALSLVINFLGDIAARGQMLRHALRYLKSDGARLLYLVLPRACVENSRYCTHAHLQAILASCGWDEVVKQDDSARLTRWLVRSTSPKSKWDGKVWKKQEIKVGKALNNFCIVVK